MPARVVEGPNLPVASANDEIRAFTEVVHQIVAGVGNLALATDKVPGARPKEIEFPLEVVGFGVATGGHQYVRGVKRRVEGSFGVPGRDIPVPRCDEVFLGHGPSRGDS